ncbi:MAG TPA: glycosyltransferase [Lacunisphaera sp.]|nr:glycosyltransferase [Lacunisphaera sp.]
MPDSATPPPTCSVIIATLDRPASLRIVLDCLARQDHPPLEVIVAAAGDSSATAALADEFARVLPIRMIPCADKSAARQRNAAAAVARGEILAFLDDDIEFGPDLFARMLAAFGAGAPAPGAIAARIAGEDRRAPGWLTRAYYRMQAGYAHADYGGRLFGCGLNCYPVFQADSPALVPAEWLPATCLFVRARLFQSERFPAFAGYSFAEDVHLTARLARSAPLYFARDCLIQHHSLASEFKSDPGALVAGKLHNMAVVAREIQGLGGWSLWWRCVLHRLFMTVVTLRSRPPRWPRVLRGIWSFLP